MGHMQGSQAGGVGQATMAPLAAPPGSWPAPYVTGHMPQYRAQHIIAGKLLSWY